jgi:hypothetical protein
MSYNRITARSKGRLRALAAATFVVAAIACNADGTNGPVTDATTTAAAPAVEAPAAPAPEMLTSSTAPGVPFGDFHLPPSLFSSSLYSGSLQALSASSAISLLNSAKSYGERVVISMAGNRSNYTNSNGTFNMTLWKNRINAFKGLNFSQFVTSGTVIGHYLIDEPLCAGCWGGTAITYAQIETMSKYSKSIWPTLPTGVRAAPSKLGSTAYSSLDFGWAQWEGPLHSASFKQTPQQFRDAQTAAAQKLRLGLVFGLNYLDGGNGTSHINGTYAKDPNLSDNVYCKSSGGCYRYAMSASEVKSVGAVLAAASYGCGLISWEYNTTFLGRSGVKDALTYVANVSKNRSRTSCVK